MPFFVGILFGYLDHRLGYRINFVKIQ